MKKVFANEKEIIEILKKAGYTDIRVEGKSSIHEKNRIIAQGKKYREEFVWENNGTVFCGWSHADKFFA